MVIPFQHGPWFAGTAATCFAHCLQRLSWLSHIKLLSQTLWWSKLSVTVWSSLSSCSSCCVYTPKNRYCCFVFNYNPLSIHSVTVVASDLTMSIFFYYMLLIQFKLFLEFNHRIIKIRKDLQDHLVQLSLNHQYYPLTHVPEYHITWSIIFVSRQKCHTMKVPIINWYYFLRICKCISKMTWYISATL